MEGVSEAVQIVNVMINGTSTALKLTGQLAHFTGHELKEFLKFVMAKQKELQMRPEKIAPGESDPFRFMVACGDNGFTVGSMVVANEAVDDFLAFAKKHNLPYARLPQTGQKETTTVLYSSRDEMAFQSFIIQDERVRVSSLSEYLGSITTQDRANVDSLLETELNYVNAFGTMLEEQNKVQTVEIDKSQISNRTDSAIEICVEHEGKLGFVKLPPDALKYDMAEGKYVVCLSNAQQATITDSPSIVKDEMGKPYDRLLTGTVLGGEAIRMGIENRKNSERAGKKSANKVFVHSDLGQKLQMGQQIAEEAVKAVPVPGAKTR